MISTIVRVRVVQHNQSGANAIKVAQTQTSTHLRVLRVRVAQHDQSGTNMDKLSP